MRCSDLAIQSELPACAVTKMWTLVRHPSLFAIFAKSLCSQNFNGRVTVPSQKNFQLVPIKGIVFKSSKHAHDLTWHSEYSSGHRCDTEACVTKGFSARLALRAALLTL